MTREQIAAHYQRQAEIAQRDRFLACEMAERNRRQYDRWFFEYHQGPGKRLRSLRDIRDPATRQDVDAQIARKRLAACLFLRGLKSRDAARRFWTERQRAREEREAAQAQHVVLPFDSARRPLR